MPPRKKKPAHDSPTPRGTTFERGRFVGSAKQSYSGLINVLKKNFYPDYHRAKNLIKVADSLDLSYYRGQWATGSLAAIRHGTAVDEQVTRTVRLFRKHNLPIQYFASAKFREKYVCSKAVRAEIIRECGRRILRDTETWWRLMERKNLTPWKSQVIVEHPSSNIATAADVVALDSEGKSVIIELKTGQTSYLFHHSGQKMRTPFQHLTDCVHNQHMLQLMATWQMYRHTWPNERVSNAIITYVTPAGAAVVPLASWASEIDVLAFMSRL